MPETKPNRQRKKRQIFFLKIVLMGAPKVVNYAIAKLHNWKIVTVDEWMEAKRSKDPEEVMMTVTITLKL